MKKIPLLILLIAALVALIIWLAARAIRTEIEMPRLSDDELLRRTG